METIAIQRLNDQTNRETLIEHAKLKGIKNYTRIPKEEVLEKWWQYQEPVDKTNIKRIKTCNKQNTKKSNTTQSNLSVVHAFINENPIVPIVKRTLLFDEDGCVCDICNSPFEMQMFHKVQFLIENANVQCNTYREHIVWLV